MIAMDARVVALNVGFNGNPAAWRCDAAQASQQTEAITPASSGSPLWDWGIPIIRASFPWRS
jgi:hypothetical protein